MVDTPADPLRPPTINLTMEEIDEIIARMERGELPKDYLDRHFDAVDANVFGHDHKKDRKGNPVEQGRGSAGNQTQQSIDAFKKWCKDEPNFAENLKRMEAELVECNKHRPSSNPRERFLKKRGGRKAA